MRSLAVRLGATLFSVLVFLVLLSSLLLPAAPVHSGSVNFNPPAQPRLITDTRWIELIRSSGPGSQLNRSVTALPTLNLHVMDNLIAGRASASALISIVVRRGTAVIVNVTATPYPDGSSYFYAVQFYPWYAPTGCGGGGSDATLQPGDIISLSQSGASFTMTVPTLTAQVDATVDDVSGSAPISGVVTTYLYRFADLTGPYTTTVTADAGGHYQADYASTLDVRPRDSGYAAYAAAPDRVTYVRFVAPFLRVQAGGTELSGFAAPRSVVVISATNSAGVQYSSWLALANSDGSFGPLSSSWNRGHIKPGDRISAASAGQTFSMTVLTITARADLANHFVAGETLANQTVEVLRFDGPLCCSSDPFWNSTAAEQAVVTATATGQYTAALAVVRPNYGAAIVTAPDGNQTYARFAVPYLTARMGANAWFSYQVTGQVDDAATPITLTIQGPSGYFKDVRTTTAASDGYFVDYNYSGLTLDSGDVITVATAHGVQAVLPLPNLTGQIDPVTDIVSGTAPPNARLNLIVYYSSYYPMMPPTPAPAATPYIIIGGGGPPSSPYTVIVTATAQGDYQVNLHGVIDLDNSSIGEVSLTTAEGYGVSRVLSLSRAESCAYAPRQIYVGGNRVDFWLPKGCTQYTYGSVRLRDGAGRLKSQQALPVGLVNYAFSIFFYAGNEPIAIEPSDIIEVEWTNSSQFVVTPTPTYTPWPVTPTPTPYAARPAAGNQLVTIVVPTLTVQLDQAANTISGHAPASTTVSVNLSRDWNLIGVYTATTDAQGMYFINPGPGMTLAAGDRAAVTSSPSGSPAFAATGVLPMLRSDWSQGAFDGYLPPLTPYTVTVKTTPPFTIPYRSVAGNDGYFSMWMISLKPGDTIAVTTAQRTLHLNIPYIATHVDRVSATVFGQAPPFARLRIEPYSYANVAQETTATASGAYSVSFPSLAPLNTTYGRITYFDAAGNQAVSPFATIHWEIVVNDKCFLGVVDAVGLPVTLTLRAANDALKSTYHFTPTYGYYGACFTQRIQSGDRIALQSAAATEVFTVPLLTARHNYARQAIEGSAPPNYALFAELWWNGIIRRRTFSDANGRYGVDTSDLQPPLLAQGRMSLSDEAGNTTKVYFIILGYPIYLPSLRR